MHKVFVTNEKPFEEPFKRLKKKPSRIARPKIDNFFFNLNYYKRSISEHNLFVSILPYLMR
jgi:hypothetical protein